MGSISPYRKGYRAQVQKDGHRATKVFKLKAEARRWIMEMEGKQVLPGHNTLAQACERYLETVSPGKQNAVKNERRRFDAFQAYFGQIALADIDSEMLGKWRDERLKTVSGSTVVREVNLYRNLFKIAQTEWKWIDSSPFEGVRLPKENAPRQAVWRWQQIKRVLREGQRRGGKTGEVVQAFHIALRTGMRLREALAAPEWFNARTKTVTIPPTKMHPTEVIPLTKEGYRLMLKMKPVEVEPNEASTIFSKLQKELLIKGLQFKDSRATALTLMARRVDILTLARISRHRNLDLLRSTYYRETAEDIAKRI
jgi:hypothetical protein